MWFWYNLQYIYSYTIIISLKSQLEQPKVQFGGQFHEKTSEGIWNESIKFILIWYVFQMFLIQETMQIKKQVYKKNDYIVKCNVKLTQPITQWMFYVKLEVCNH